MARHLSSFPELAGARAPAYSPEPNLETAARRSPFACAARSHVGLVRPHNEDRVGAFETPALLVLADGMGGFNAGEVASGLAIETITNVTVDMLRGATPPERALAHAFIEANRAICSTAQRRPECLGMGTTAVAVLIDGARLWHAHIGDSRAYLFRRGRLHRLTTDHTISQQMCTAGQLTERQARLSAARGVLTRALGVEPNVFADVDSIELEHGDSLLLCSDGLTDMVLESEIAILMAKSHLSLDEAAEAMISAALAGGGIDNVSVIVARRDIGNGPHGQPAAFA